MTPGLPNRVDAPRFDSGGYSAGELLARLPLMGGLFERVKGIEFSLQRRIVQPWRDVRRLREKTDEL
jgi:hypothetical protein